MKFALIFYIFLINKLNCASDVVTDQTSTVCGKPGHSKLSQFSPVKRLYRANEVVNYSCENSEMVLIGPAQRVCSDGKWMKKIPKCASKLPNTQVSHQEGKVAVISVNKTSRISAVSVNLFARKTTINISKVKGLPEYNCSKTITGADQDEKGLTLFTINFLCKSNFVRASQYKENNTLTIIFSSEITCELDCSNKLKKDEVPDLYEINEDDCDKPDSPIYAYAKRYPSSSNRTSHGKSQNLNKPSLTDLKPITPKMPTSTTSNKIGSGTSSTKPSNQTTQLPDSVLKNLTLNILSSTTTSSTTTNEFTKSITPSPTTTAAQAETLSKLPPHYYDTISSDVTFSNETVTENPILISDQTIDSNQTASPNVTIPKKAPEVNRQKYYCNQHFNMNIENDDYDEVMSMSRYAVKQFEKCEKGEDWLYVRMPECVPQSVCTLPKFADNVVPIYSNLYLNEFAVVHDEIRYVCLNDDRDVNIGGSLQTCLLFLCK